ncbi:hypothetical protein [Denitratisoma sp. agr-D3]
MMSIPAPFRRLIARLLAATLLVVGLLDPSAVLAETLQDHAPQQCASLMADPHPAPPVTLTDVDLGDSAGDLEQLLRPSSLAVLPPPLPRLAFLPPATGSVPVVVAPLLRPPIFRA